MMAFYRAARVREELRLRKFFKPLLLRLEPRVRTGGIWLGILW